MDLRKFGMSRLAVQNITRFALLILLANEGFIVPLVLFSSVNYIPFSTNSLLSSLGAGLF
jgi:hypothetical protein